MQFSKRGFFVAAALAIGLAAIGPVSAAPSVYPTGATIYEPEKAENGYTVLSILGTRAVVVIDMNGRVVKRWDDFNVSAGGPARVLPGGYVIAPNGARQGRQEALELLARDFNGQELWKIDRIEEIALDDVSRWSARQHHDWQRSDFPAGYPSPQAVPAPSGGKTLLLTHTSHTDPAIADVELEDDRIVEVDENGVITWEWRAADHFAEFGLDGSARLATRRLGTRDGYDWFHINSATYVGPNKWFDAGDARFDPENIVISSRQTSVVAIISHADGSIVWQIGPNFLDTPEEAAIGQIIGQHHAHIIPRGLPGAGNLLVFDNGGSSGYGDPSPIAPTGNGIYARSTSRVLEIDPVTLKLVWSYRAPNFFSTNISGAQRLANGNTLVTEGAPGRVFEVTSDERPEIVWEYQNATSGSGPFASPAVYRAYRIPYSWIPQLEQPEEIAIPKPDNAVFHVWEEGAQ